MAANYKLLWSLDSLSFLVCMIDSDHTSGSGSRESENLLLFASLQQSI